MLHFPRGATLLLLLIIPLLACDFSIGTGGNTVATPIPLPTNVSLATSTPRATSTPAPTDTPAATDTPLPTATPAGGFSAITFAAGVLNGETPIDPLATFPDGVTIVYGFFNGINLPDGTTWHSDWLRNGQVQSKLSADHTWDAKIAGPQSIWWLSVFDPNGVGAGQWELDLSINKQLVQSGKFTIETNTVGQPDFGPITFAENQKNDQPVNPVKVGNPTFPAGTTSVYAFFDGKNVPKNTQWTSQWFRNGDVETDPKSHTWTFGPNENEWINLAGPNNGALDPGTYELKLTIGSRLVNIGTFIIPQPTGGTTPTPAPSPTSAFASTCPTPTPGAEVPPGFEIGVTMAENTQGANLDPVNPTRVFDPKSIFHAVVDIHDAPDNTNFKAVWYATDVGGVAACNTLIDSFTLTSGGTRNLDFKLSPATTWAVGLYRVELYVNDTLAIVTDFTVQ